MKNSFVVTVKMFVDIEQQKGAINPRQWNFIEDDDERIWKGFRHACHQNKGLSPRRILTNDKTRARNFNKILIIYLQQQLRSFTSQTEANFGGIISLVLVATLPISLEYLDGLNCSLTTGVPNLFVLPSHNFNIVCHLKANVTNTLDLHVVMGTILTESK